MCVLVLLSISFCRFHPFGWDLDLIDFVLFLRFLLFSNVLTLFYWPRSQQSIWAGLSWAREPILVGSSKDLKWWCDTIRQVDVMRQPVTPSFTRQQCRTTVTSLRCVKRWDETKRCVARCDEIRSEETWLRQRFTDTSDALSATLIPCGQDEMRCVVFYLAPMWSRWDEMHWHLPCSYVVNIRWDALSDPSIQCPHDEMRYSVCYLETMWSRCIMGNLFDLMRKKLGCWGFIG